LKRLQGRPDGFFWTWAQCHVQVWYNMAYLGGKPEGLASAAEVWRPSNFPDGDHLRLIAAHAISAGCRGCWFLRLSHFCQASRPIPLSENDWRKKRATITAIFVLLPGC
jgi:hypothetical protein